MKPIKAVNVNNPDKEFLEEFHKMLAKSLVRKLGIYNSRKLLELIKEEKEDE